MKERLSSLPQRLGDGLREGWELAELWLRAGVFIAALEMMRQARVGDREKGRPQPQ